MSGIWLVTAWRSIAWWPFVVVLGGRAERDLDVRVRLHERLRDRLMVFREGRLRIQHVQRDLLRYGRICRHARREDHSASPLIVLEKQPMVVASFWQVLPFANSPSLVVIAAVLNLRFFGYAPGPGPAALSFFAHSRGAVPRAVPITLQRALIT